MSASQIGEVIRYRYPTTDGKITLIALTPEPNVCMLGEPVQCEPAREIWETERLYRKLWDHVHRVTPVSASGALPDRAAPPLRLVG